MILIEIIPRLILISQSEIFKLSKLIQKNFKVFELLEVITKKKGMYSFIKKYGAQNSNAHFPGDDSR